MLTEIYKYDIETVVQNGYLKFILKNFNESTQFDIWCYATNHINVFRITVLLMFVYSNVANSLGYQIAKIYIVK
jgi:hypothetical protein